MTTQWAIALSIVSILYWIAMREIPDLILFLRRKYFGCDDE